MLAEVVEQRYPAVRKVLDSGAAVTDVAVTAGRCTRWLVRYGNEGLAGLVARSPRPDRCPHQISTDVEAMIVTMRRAHAGWGPRIILNHSAGSARNDARDIARGAG